MTDLETLRAAAEYLKDQPRTPCDPYPNYDGRVIAALNTLPPDYDYLAHHEKIADKPIEKLTLAELATMYTFLQRGERFCDGHIAAYIKDGTLYKLVKRQQELLVDVPVR